MERILEHIVQDYQLNENDRYMLQYVLDHSEEVVHMSTRQLAEKTYTNATAVVRFVKKLGFANYGDFKIHLHDFLSRYHLQKMEILSHEGLLSIMDKLAALEAGIIDQTRSMISLETFKQVMALISQKQYIDIIAKDTNACIGDYASHLLCSLGKIVTVYQNEDRQLWLSLNSDDQHTVIVISKYGRDPHLKNVANILVQRGIPLIIITSHKASPLTKKQALTLYGVIHDEFAGLKDMIFYVSLKYLFDLVYSLLISENLSQAEEWDRLYERLYNQQFKG